MKTSLLHLCLLTAATLAFHPSAHAETWVHPLPICPPPLPLTPTFPLPVCPAPVPVVPKPCPLAPAAALRDQVAVTGTDDGCVRLPGKPTRPLPFTAAV
ncbi:hypothetical protein [Prosthecobacter fluviatilis]|uniref:Uncharacterized protein n=1 Tax=Prosthecobacter fluviatilis TaxID=445931 RepID=A0ABW0KY38_9BACT